MKHPVTSTSVKKRAAAIADKLAKVHTSLPRDLDKVHHEIDRVLKNIFVSTEAVLKYEQFLKDKEIVGVLNVTKDVELIHGDGLETLRIPIDDNLKDQDQIDAYNYMPLAAAFIHKYVQLSRKNVLVHCWAGRQRSISMVAAYLITYHDLSVEQAVLYLVKARHEAFRWGTSFNFGEALVAYSDSIKNCDRAKLPSPFTL